MTERLTIYGTGQERFPCVKCGELGYPLSTFESASGGHIGQFINASYCRDCRFITTPLGSGDP